MAPKINKSLVVQFLLQGEEHAHIAAVCGCSVSSVDKTARQHGIRNKAEPAEVARMIRMIETMTLKGEPDTAIASKINRAQSTVRWYRMQMRMRKPRHMNEETGLGPVKRHTPTLKPKHPEHCGLLMTPTYSNWPGRRPVWVCEACGATAGRVIPEEAPPLAFDQAIAERAATLQLQTEKRV